MPKKIDLVLEGRVVRPVREHRADYSSNAKAVEAVAQQKGGGRESLRRWMTASEREGHQRRDRGEQAAEEDVAIPKAAAARDDPAADGRCGNMTGEATQSHRSRCGRTRMPDRIAPRSPTRRSSRSMASPHRSVRSAMRTIAPSWRRSPGSGLLT